MLNIDIKYKDIWLVHFDVWSNKISFVDSFNFTKGEIVCIPDNYFNEIYHKACSSNACFVFRDNLYRVFCDSCFFDFVTFSCHFHSVKIKRYLFDAIFDFNLIK